MSKLVELVCKNASLETLKANLWDNRNIHGYIDFSNDLGYTALDIAVLSDDGFEIAEFLLDNGANVNNLGVISGCTPLMRACHLGIYNSVKFLLEHGADISIVSKKGFTAECFSRKENVLRLLNSYKENSNLFSAKKDNYAVINGARYKLVQDGITCECTQ